MKLRIIAGEKGGLGLVAPKGLATRPTQGRVRESLFMMLEPKLRGARVADLFAGSGSLGLEALSRGAEHCAFVENARPALDALRANIDKADWASSTTVIARDALAWLRTPPSDPADRFDLILIDPPYERGLALRSLELIGSSADAWLRPGGWALVQAESRLALPQPAGALTALRHRDYSETRITFFGVASAAPHPEASR